MDRSSIFAFAIIALFLSVAVVAFVIRFLKDRKRAETLLTLAPQWGFGFEPKPESVDVAGSGVDLFARGHSKRCLNLLTGEGKSAGTYVFDYRYKTGRGRSTRHHRQTVVGFDLGAGRLPKFSVQPRSLRKSFGAVFSGGQIKLAEYPEFARGHFVAGESEDAVRGVLSGLLVDVLTDDKAVCLEGNGRWLVVYRQRAEIDPLDVPGLVEHAGRLRDLTLANAQAR